MIELLATLALVVPHRWAGQDVERLPTGEKVVALTFDASWSYDSVPLVLRTLAREDVPATFFLTGIFARKDPRATATIARRYELAAHTETHRDLTRLGDAQVRGEIVGGDRTVTRYAHVAPARLLRFPYGARDARTIRLANALGYVCVRWSIDTWGWMRVSPQTVVQRFVSRLRPGAIVLMHLGAPSDARALAGVIRAGRARGYRFVAVGEYIP